MAVAFAKTHGLEAEAAAALTEHLANLEDDAEDFPVIAEVKLSELVAMS